MSAAGLVSSRPRETSATPTPELNCLVCHTSDPAIGLWIESIRSGESDWATTATLANTSLVERSGTDWRWNANAFGTGGVVGSSTLRIANPSIENCALCHGIAGSGMGEPVTLEKLGSSTMSTLATGEIFSPQRIANSGINISGKERLSRTWDVHAERLLDCTDCHHSINNPAYCREADDTQPKGLKFDGRRVPIAVYLRRPEHNLAGQRDPKGERDYRLACTKCHDPQPTHVWLPYAQRHFDRLTCQACHTPKLYSAAIESIDWTLTSDDGTPLIAYRGTDARDTITAENLVDGYEPVLLLDRDADGSSRLAPFNLVTSWYWVAGDRAQPVPTDSIALALHGDAGNETGLFAVLDTDGNDSLDRNELVLDTEAKVALMREQLISLGYHDPRIVGEIKPYRVNHNTTRGTWATRDCEHCHQSDSRIAMPILLSQSPPAGVVPAAVEAAPTDLTGDLRTAANGSVVFQPKTRMAGFYVIGHDYSVWANVFGLFVVTAVLGGVVTHAVLRWRAARSQKQTPAPHTTEVYMYTVYERFWHWLQATAIIVLLVTGIEIHFSSVDLFGFAAAVRVHNIVGFIVVANAVFAAFYHLASGEIRHYLPEPAGFFGQGITQAKFYLSGIFRGHPHPFEKRPDKKLNPLQQITYLSILNILLPIQVITGLGIWGAQRWAVVDTTLGGLNVLAPIHALGAWLFAAFLLLHVYLTTTGPTPTANIQAMLHGWERAQSHLEVLEKS